MIRPSAFTLRGNGLLRVLKSQAGISLPFIGDKPNAELIIKSFTAIWDTGATNSMITQNVVDSLNLQPTGLVVTHTANGTVNLPRYLVNIVLPNNITVHNVRVAAGNLNEADVLIGMDIINFGDFSITNHNNQTIMSFCIPSFHEIDYVKDLNNKLLSKSEKKKLERATKKINLGK